MKIKRTNTFVTAIRVILFTVMLLLVSQRVKCQPSNNNALSPRQIDFSTMIERAKSYSPEDFTFSVSAPSLIAQSADGWEIAYYVFVDDIEYMELPSELMLLKKSRVLDLSMATLKALAFTNKTCTKLE